MPSQVEIAAIVTAQPDLKVGKIPKSTAVTYAWDWSKGDKMEESIKAYTALFDLMGELEAHGGLREFDQKRPVMREDMMFLERYDYDAKICQTWCGFEEEAHKALAAMMTLPQPEYKAE